MEQTDVLIRSLVIALLLVSPYAIYKVRQVRRTNSLTARAAKQQAEVERRASGPHGHVPALEDVIGDIGFVETEAHRNGGALLVVPHEVTISDRPAPPEMVDTLVRDALRRSNLVITAEIESDEGRMLECAPTTPTQAMTQPGTEPGTTDAARPKTNAARLQTDAARLTEEDR